MIAMGPIGLAYKSGKATRKSRRPEPTKVDSSQAYSSRSVGRRELPPDTTPAIAGQRSPREARSKALTSNNPSDESNIIITGMAKQLDPGYVEAALRFPNFAKRENQIRDDDTQRRGRSPQKRPLNRYAAKEKASFKGPTAKASSSSASSSISLDLDIFDFEDEDEPDLDWHNDSAGDSSDSDDASELSSTHTDVDSECNDCGQAAAGRTRGVASKSSIAPSHGILRSIYARHVLPDVGRQDAHWRRTSADLDMIWDDDEKSPARILRKGKAERNSGRSASLIQQRSSRGSASGMPLLKSGTLSSTASVRANERLPIARRVSEPLPSSSGASSGSTRMGAAQTSSPGKESASRLHDADTLIRYAATRARLHRSASLALPVWDPRCYHYHATPQANAQPAQTDVATSPLEGAPDAASTDVTQAKMMQRATIVSRRWSHDDAAHRAFPSADSKAHVADRRRSA